MWCQLVRQIWVRNVLKKSVRARVNKNFNKWSYWPRRVTAAGTWCAIFSRPRGFPHWARKKAAAVACATLAVCSTISACLPPALATAAAASGPRGMHTPNKEICDAELCPRLSAPCISVCVFAAQSATSQLSTRLHSAAAVRILQNACSHTRTLYLCAGLTRRRMPTRWIH